VFSVVILADLKYFQMKQPELGKKISELRKEKGLTQEELVEKCNISVRTLQRIETGEVTPRFYTVRTILDALEADLDKISENGDSIIKRFLLSIRNILLINIVVKPSESLIKQLNTAWVFGSIYFLLTIFEIVAEFYRKSENQMIIGISMYIFFKVCIILSFFIFQRGFVLIGEVFKNYLLKIISYILILGVFMTSCYDIASLFYNSIERDVVLGVEALTFGGIGVLFGISLLKLQKKMGIIALLAGVIEISAAFFFLTILLSIVGQILLIPEELLEIILVFKSIEIIKKRMVEKEDFNQVVS
jgi:transcriptional regulator with XRE-family HTH domain